MIDKKQGRKPTINDTISAFKKHGRKPTVNDLVNILNMVRS